MAERLNERYRKMDNIAWDCYTKLTQGILLNEKFHDECNGRLMETFQEKYRFEPEFKGNFISGFVAEFRKSLVSEKIPFDESALEFAVTEFCDMNNRTYFESIEKSEEDKISLLRLVKTSGFKELLEEAYIRTFDGFMENAGEHISRKKIIENYIVDPNIRSIFIKNVINHAKEAANNSIGMDDELFKIIVGIVCDDKMNY